MTPFDLSVLDQFSSATQWAQTLDHPIDVDTMRQALEDTLTEQATTFSLIQYWGYECTDTWGEVGKQASQATYLELWTGVLATDFPHPHHWDHLRQRLDMEYRERDIDAIPQDCVKPILADFRFFLFENEFQLHDSPIINSLLQFFGSDYYLQSGDYGDERELILGIGTRSFQSEFLVVDLHREVIRTANIVSSLAAAIGDQQIVIRHHALDTIFKIKWEMFVDYPHSHSEDINYKIGHFLKAKTLMSYTIASRLDLETTKDLFLSEMRDNILNHELGHGIIQRHTLPRHIATFSEATKLLSHPFIHSLLEVLAEIAPRLGSIIGPLGHIVETSKTDSKKAERMVWMYISDTWFFDTPDDYMYHYSELVALIFGTITTIAGTLDFATWDTRIWKKDGVFDLTCTAVIDTCSQLIDRLRTQHFVVDGSRISFDDIKTRITTEVESDHHHTVDPYIVEATIWHKLLEVALTHDDFIQDADLITKNASGKYQKQLAAKLGLNPNDALDAIRTRWSV